MKELSVFSLWGLPKGEHYRMKSAHTFEVKQEEKERLEEKMKAEDGEFKKPITPSKPKEEILPVFNPEYVEAAKSVNDEDWALPVSEDEESGDE